MLCGNKNKRFSESLGIALKANPAVKWYFQHKCPESADYVEAITRGAPDACACEAREAEVIVMDGIEDFILYCYPELMDSRCDFIYAWDKSRLFELADFTGKVVLDVGSGSGRLAFAAAQRAEFVYASEPVDSLREYLRDKIARLGIKNMRVCDGMAHALPFPDDTFDIVMSGHVVGDNPEEEIAELTRVAKNGGLLLDCPGEEARKREPDAGFIEQGFEVFHYSSVLGGDVYRYKKRVIK